jgi:hypothetical protein
MQMHLDHLDKERCPSCKAEISEMRKDGRHCSGEWNEHVRYRCGHELRYSPNFRRIEEVVRCPHCDDEKRRRAGVRAFYEAVAAFASSTECPDPEFKNRMLYWIDSCRPR